MRALAIAGFALLALDMSFSGARAGFWDELFGGPQQRAAPAAPMPRHNYRAAPLVDPDEVARPARRYRVSNVERSRAGVIDRRLSGSISMGEPLKTRASRGAAQKGKRGATETASTGGDSSVGRYVCVRLCDGAVVSLARRRAGDEASPRLPSCDNACPGSEVRLYTLPNSGDDISSAVDAVSKTSYAELAARVKAPGEARKSCACGSIAAKLDIDVDEFFDDRTLRNGDVVATTDGLRVFRGGRRLPHRNDEFLAFDEMRGRMPKSTHGALNAINETLKTARTLNAESLRAVDGDPEQRSNQ